MIPVQRLHRNKLAIRGLRRAALATALAFRPRASRIANLMVNVIGTMAAGTTHVIRRVNACARLPGLALALWPRSRGGSSAHSIATSRRKRRCRATLMPTLARHTAFADLAARQPAGAVTRPARASLAVCLAAPLPRGVPGRGLGPVSATQATLHAASAAAPRDHVRMTLSASRMRPPVPAAAPLV